MRHYKTRLSCWMCSLAFILILPIVVSAGQYTDFRFPREKQLTKDGYPTPLSGQPITKTPVIAKKKVLPLRNIRNIISLEKRSLVITRCESLC